jgi:hypothetical protein
MHGNRSGCTALHYAVDGSQMETVELALDEGADIEAKDIQEWTPLMRGGWWKWKEKCLKYRDFQTFKSVDKSSRAISITLVVRGMWLTFLGFFGVLFRL